MTLYTIEEYKKENEQYQKIIDKQRVTIKTLRSSITHLINENELLMKRNKELEVLSAQSIDYEHNNTSSIKSIPVPPPRSPFRNNINSQDKSPSHQFQKRPPVLNLVKSNHSLHQQLDPVKNDYPISPSRYNTSSSPSSSTSTSSSDRQSIESDPFYLTSPKHHEYSPSSPKYKDIPTITLDQHLHPSKSEPTTPSVPRTPRIDSLPQLDKNNLSNINIKVIHFDVDRHKKASWNDHHFLVAVIHKENNHEMWRVEKSFNDLIYLDAKVRI